MRAQIHVKQVVIGFLGKPLFDREKLGKSETGFNSEEVSNQPQLWKVVAVGPGMYNEFTDSYTPYHFNIGDVVFLDFQAKDIIKEFPEYLYNGESVDWFGATQVVGIVDMERQNAG